MLLYSHEKDNLGAKKTISISHHLVDMDGVLYTINEDGSEHVLSTHKIRNTNTAKSSPIFTKDTFSHAKVSLTFKFDKSGMLEVQKGEAILIESIPVEPKKSNTTEVESEQSEAEVEEKIKYKEKSHPFTLKLTSKRTGAQTLNTAQMNKAKKRLNDLEVRDKKMEKIKIAQNEYEGLIFSSRDYVEDDENAPYFKDQDEKDKLLLFIQEEENWIYNTEEVIDFDTYKNKIKVLERKMKPIKQRKEIRDQLPQDISKAKTEVDTILKSFNKYKRSNSWLPTEKLTEFEAMITSTKEYLDSRQQDLKDIPLYEKVSFKSIEIQGYVTSANDKLKEIKRLKKPKEPKSEVESHGDLSEKKPGKFQKCLHELYIVILKLSLCEVIKLTR